jgi:hypothetical protein
MPDNQPPKLPADAFASFAAVPGAAGRRRRSTWPLRPMHEPSAGEATDAARRFVNEDQVLQALGRRQAKE